MDLHIKDSNVIKSTSLHTPHYEPCLHIYKTLKYNPENTRFLIISNNIKSIEIAHCCASYLPMERSYFAWETHFLSILALHSAGDHVRANCHYVIKATGACTMIKGDRLPSCHSLYFCRMCVFIHIDHEQWECYFTELALVCYIWMDLEEIWGYLWILKIP